MREFKYQNKYIVWSARHLKHNNQSRHRKKQSIERSRNRTVQNKTIIKMDFADIPLMDLNGEEDHPKENGNHVNGDAATNASGAQQQNPYPGIAFNMEETLPRSSPQPWEQPMPNTQKVLIRPPDDFIQPEKLLLRQPDSPQTDDAVSPLSSTDDDSSEEQQQQQHQQQQQEEPSSSSYIEYPTFQRQPFPSPSKQQTPHDPFALAPLLPPLPPPGPSEVVVEDEDSNDPVGDFVRTTFDEEYQWPDHLGF